MATYQELYGLRDHAMIDRIKVAIIIAAEAIRTESAATPDHVARLVWAKEAFSNAESVARRMFWAVIAANAGLSVAQITGATDAQLQTAVNSAVAVFI